MTKTEGEPGLQPEGGDISLEDETIALSDSELDNVLKSADIAGAEGPEDESNLERYGVWVKVEPQSVETEAEGNTAFELSDLGSSEQSTLTDEEEQLLGELEEETNVNIDDLSGLEEDLEELGKGTGFAEEQEEEELTVEDLDVELDELGEEALSVPEDAGIVEGLPELEGEAGAEGGDFDLNLDRESEIEVPLSDSAAVEEHYEDLAAMEGVPSTPGQIPPQASADILEKIERDLNQIKAEIQSLKSELAGIGRGGRPTEKVDIKPAQAAADGFFQKGEDETIALTGDELDNILNTADVTEEVEGPEETVESLEEPELAEEDLLAEQPVLEEMPEAAELTPESPDEIIELGSLDVEEELPPELPAEELSLEEEAIEIDIGEKQAEEELVLEEISPAEAPLEDLEELSLETPEEPISLEAEDLESGEEIETLEVEPESLEELSLEEPEGEQGLEELEEIEELSLEEAGEEAPVQSFAAEQIPEEDLGLAEVQELEEPILEELPEVEAAGVPEEEQVPDLELETEDLEVADLEAPQVSLSEADEAGTDNLSEDLQTDIKSVLSYLDQLLGALPNDKIEEFAQSEYFGIYKRLFEELGLGA